MSDPERSDRTQDQIDRDLDAEMEKALAPTPAEKSEVPLRRQWDDEMEAELEAALAGFDTSSYEVATPHRDRADDRAHILKGERGQEGRPGLRKGKVVAVRGKSVFVDLGTKSEGVVPVEQFQGKPPSPGDMIDVVVDRFDPDEGLLLLSLKGAAVEANWENLCEGVVIEARVTKAIKGGLEIEAGGIRGFLPVSQIEMGRVEDVSPYINQKFRVMVTEADPRRKNLIVSRRDLLEKEREAQRAKTWAELEEGQVRPGVVRSIKDFGAFVDLGGVDGLIHISDLSWARVADVSQMLKLGQEVQVKVLKIDRQNNKVSLGLKQLMPSPWDNAQEKYSPGKIVPGKVTKLMDFGAFVALEPGVEGLIHISELSPNRVRRVADIVQPGQDVEVRVLKLDPDARKISLSLLLTPTTPPEPEPESEEEDKTLPPPKPERKIPLKGGLGDRDVNPFGR
jgi:ribosomal protein S1